MNKIIIKSYALKAFNTGGITLLVCLLVFFFVSARQEDPLDILFKQLPDSKIQQKILIFKKAGFGRSLSAHIYDKEGIIKSARSFLGTPHRMGGISHEGIDCSGLVMIAHQQNGIVIPRDGNEQARYGRIILSLADLKRGDLVFFHSTYNTTKLVTHSGIYLGDFQFIHVSSKKGATIDQLTSKYWSAHFLFGTRLDE
jgi:hypothetical protein